MGDLTITMTNTLDENKDNESIGFSEFTFNYLFEDGTAGFPTESPAYYDSPDVENPT
jgi:hypothetical protein